MSFAAVGCKKKRSAPTLLPPGPSSIDAVLPPVQAAARPSLEPEDAGPAALPPAECHNVVLQGDPVTNKYSAKAPPQPVGGYIVPGTYVLIERVVYENVPKNQRSAIPRRMTMVVSDDSGLQLAVSEQIQGAREDRKTAKIATVAKSRLKVIWTCSHCTSNCEFELPYTASRNNLQLFTDDESMMTIMTLSLVPIQTGGKVNTGTGGHRP
jgi:hypothetical protein